MFQPHSLRVSSGALKPNDIDYVLIDERFLILTQNRDLCYCLVAKWLPDLQEFTPRSP
jgi:hypothetical protein